MRVLHCFDKYLNSTMNWAYHAITHTPDSQPMIAAPLLVYNQFHNEHFKYFKSEWQWERPGDEWSVSLFQRGIARLFRERYWKNVFDRLKKAPPAIVHAHFAPVGCAVMEWTQKNGLPLMTSFYGTDYERVPFVRPEFLARYQELFRRSALLVCEGEHGASILEKTGCPAAKIRIVPLGIEPETVPFHLRKKTPAQLMLLQAATIVEKKGHLATLEAFKRALNTCPNMHLTIAGEPVDKKIVKTMRQFIAGHGLQHRVTWLDFVDTRQFHRFLGEFDVLIQPSCYAADRDCEGGAPIVLLDAQATGLPVIATTHCDIPAEVLHGRTGLLAPEGDVTMLAAHIERFYWMQNDEYQIFSNEASRHVARHFDIRNTGLRLHELYQTLISHPTSRTS